MANVEFYQDEEVTLTLTMSPPTSLVGWTLECTLQPRCNEEGRGIVKTIGDGLRVADVDHGKVEIELTAEDREMIASGGCVYEVRRTNEGQRAVIAQGYIRCLPLLSNI